VERHGEGGSERARTRLCRLGRREDDGGEDDAGEGVKRGGAWVLRWGRICVYVCLCWVGYAGMMGLG
jgi:hypothetical protein